MVQYEVVNRGKSGDEDNYVFTSSDEHEARDFFKTYVICIAACGMKRLVCLWERGSNGDVNSELDSNYEDWIK